MAEDEGTLGFKIDIDSEAVNQRIASAILDSALGKQLSSAVEKALMPSYGRSLIQTTVDVAIESEVKMLAREMVRTELRDVIKAKLLEKLTPENLDVIADAFVTKLGLITSEDMGLR